MSGYEQWWRGRKPTRYWAARYTKRGEDHFDEAQEVLRRSREAVEARERREMEARVKLAASEADRLIEAARAEAATARADALEAKHAELRRHLLQSRYEWAAAVTAGLFALCAIMATSIIWANHGVIEQQKQQRTELIAARASGLLRRPELAGAADALLMLLFPSNRLGAIETIYSDALVSAR